MMIKPAVSGMVMTTATTAQPMGASPSQCCPNPGTALVQACRTHLALSAKGPTMALHQAHRKAAPVRHQVRAPSSSTSAKPPWGGTCPTLRAHALHCSPGAASTTTSPRPVAQLLPRISGTHSGPTPSLQILHCMPACTPASTLSPHAHSMPPGLRPHHHSTVNASSGFAERPPLHLGPPGCTHACACAAAMHGTPGPAVQAGCAPAPTPAARRHRRRRTWSSCPLSTRCWTAR